MSVLKRATYDALADLYEDPDNEANVVLFYTGRSQSKEQRVNEDNQNGWNREHIWPQSHGTRQSPMKSDLHNLKPADSTVNARRGNLDFDVGGDPEGEAPDTFFDFNSFEPRDDVKGDVARALLYVDLRYEGTDGEPDLVLVDGSTGPGTAAGDLCTALDWHLSDPVTEDERVRNDMIERLQGNRNVFVDEPNLALQIFGISCGHDVTVPVMSDVDDEPAVIDEQPGVRLATWNIANFWHVDGEHLRPRRDGRPGLIRVASNYQAILNVIGALDADIIGLQEIASPEAARRLFPETEWDLVFSRRFSDDLAADPDRLDSSQTRDIYTALVVRRAVAKVEGTERLELDILHEDGRPVREGIAALIDVDGFRFWAASLHMKSGCFFDNDLTRRDDCRTLAKQIPILEDWIDEKSAAGWPVALLGDFNRRLDRGHDTVREDLDDLDPVDLFKIPHRQELMCSTFSKQPRTSIDYIIVNQALWAFTHVSAIPNLDIANPVISDHCPVFIDVRLPD
ncbi:MAG: endonuclease [Pseudomonadota bacterium]